MSRIQLLEASSAYQVMVLAAAIDSGLLGDADRRILLTSANGAVPEAASPLGRQPALASVLGRFDDVRSYNDLVQPLHPSAFRPRTGEQALFERLFRTELGIDATDALELVVESVHVPPARSLVNVFGGAAITVYAEGLMSYGPTRDRLPGGSTGRIERLIHLDLVPGLQPALLREHGVPALAVDDAAFRAVVRELRPTDTAPAPRRPYALILGQYLAELGLMSAAAEQRMVADLVSEAARSGFPLVLVKPHPSAPPQYGAALRRRAAEVGIELRMSTESAPVEVLYEQDPPGLVLGCFSTGLVTAGRFWSIPARSAGAAALLGALPRFEDSNRVPLVLVDAVVPPVGDEGRGPVDVAALQRVLDTVAYCMQPELHRSARSAAAAHLGEGHDALERAVPRDRRRRLMLPGGSLAASPEAFDRIEAVRSSARAAAALGGSVRRRLAPRRSARRPA